MIFQYQNHSHIDTNMEWDRSYVKMQHNPYQNEPLPCINTVMEPAKYINGIQKHTHVEMIQIPYKIKLLSYRNGTNSTLKEMGPIRWKLRCNHFYTKTELPPW